MKLVSVFALCCGLLFSSNLSAQDKALQNAVASAKAGKMQPLMRQKLQYSQSLWEGVATENFGMIKSSLDQLEKVAKETVWQSLDIKDFQLYSNYFQSTVTELKEKVGQNDIKSLALPYVRLHLNCMECHDLVRKKMRSKK